jgi:hypothetical protein
VPLVGGTGLDEIGMLDPMQMSLIDLRVVSDTVIETINKGIEFLL